MWYLDAAFQGVDIKTFTELYGKAMQYAQKSYKIAQHLPAAALILAQYFYSKKNYPSVTKLCEKVLEYTDVQAIASDAYYWIARTHHQLQQYDRAMAFYQKARATNEANLPAAIGIGQLQVLQNDLISAKLTFERLLERHPRCIEALTILAFLYAGEANDRSTKMDKSNEKAKARGFFERALKLIDETQGRTLDDPVLCIAQAQLCEVDDVDMSLKCTPYQTIANRSIGTSKGVKGRGSIVSAYQQHCRSTTYQRKSAFRSVIVPVSLGRINQTESGRR